MVLDIALGVLLALALLIGGFFLFVFLASHAKQIAKAIGIVVALSVAVIAFIVVREQFPQPGRSPIRASEQAVAPAYQQCRYDWVSYEGREITMRNTCTGELFTVGR